MIKFTIPICPITKKNHQRIVKNARGAFVVPSAQYQNYEKNALWFIPKQKQPIDYPVEVKALFYMETRRKVDLTNLLEALDDVLVKAKFLLDDNSTIIQSHDGSRVLYDKEHPRTEVYVFEVKP